MTGEVPDPFSGLSPCPDDEMVAFGVRKLGDLLASLPGLSGTPIYARMLAEFAGGQDLLVCSPRALATWSMVAAGVDIDNILPSPFVMIEDVAPVPALAMTQADLPGERPASLGVPLRDERVVTPVGDGVPDLSAGTVAQALPVASATPVVESASGPDAVVKGARARRRSAQIRMQDVMAQAKGSPQKDAPTAAHDLLLGGSGDEQVSTAG